MPSRRGLAMLMRMEFSRSARRFDARCHEPPPANTSRAAADFLTGMMGRARRMLLSFCHTGGHRYAAAPHFAAASLEDCCWALAEAAAAMRLLAPYTSRAYGHGRGSGNRWDAMLAAQAARLTAQFCYAEARCEDDSS